MRAIRTPLRVLGSIAVGLAVLLMLLWTIGLVWTWEPSPVWRAAIVLLLVGLPGFLLARRGWRPAARVVFVLFFVSLMVFSMLQPRQDRSWVVPEDRTAFSAVRGDHVTIRNVRDFGWRSEEDYDVRWRTESYPLDEIETLWLVFVPFRELSVGAHTFVSFGFRDGRYLAVSIEARKERGEVYEILPALYRHYETIYVVGTERDLVGLRSHVRRDAVHVYPVRSTPAGRRAFLLSMLESANRLHEHPAFYNVLTDTCATGLVDHLDAVREESLGFDLRVLLPGFSDRVAFEEGLIDTDLPLAEARRRHHVGAEKVALDAPDFSDAIRRP